MRYCYQALLDVSDEAKQEMIKEGREFSVKYVLDEVRHTYSSFFLYVAVYLRLLILL